MTRQPVVRVAATACLRSGSPRWAQRQTRNADAYDFYLRGVNFSKQRTPATNRRAMKYYERAIALDPGYALAWSGIARTYSASTINADAPRSRSDRGRGGAVFDWLDKSYAAHDVNLIFLPVDPKWDPYRDDPRFRALLARCGFTRNE